MHQLSAGRERRFCDVNCTAFPEELLESDLFGHAKGAFAGAVVDRAGLFEEGGNRARAARALGLSRQGLRKTLARLGVERTSTREG